VVQEQRKVTQFPKIKVTKLDAAKRQLRAAIRLFFDDDDPVAIHTLAAASQEIIHRLYRNKGLDNLLFDSCAIHDEFRAEWARTLKAPATFFKHAKQDADGILEFCPDVNAFFILFSCKALNEMQEPPEVEEFTFMQWFLIHNPHIATINGGLLDSVPVVALHQLRRA
jgi:hypothetical protein